MHQTPPANASSSAGRAGVSRSQQSWRETRAWLNNRRWELARSASSLYEAAPRVAGTVLLTRPSWVPPSPIPLEQIQLTWTEDKPEWAIHGDEAGISQSTAFDDHGQEYPRYSEAMRALSPPRIFENRTCYGLRELNAADATMLFGAAEYFANIDIGEAVAHEYAAAAMRNRGNVGLSSLSFRRLIGDPVDVTRRPVPVAISALVLRVDRAAGKAQMLLHWRDPQKVASGGGLYQVAPVGVFQPSDDAEWNLHNDFDLWRSIQRELSEELLGTSEDYASSTRPIDYGAWPFAQALDQARGRGHLAATWLGAGVDPLTLVCDLLCCVTIDASVFDSVFATLVDSNDEGNLITADDATGRTVGVPFAQDSIDRYSTDQPMQPAGAALLRLAWQHRSYLIDER